MGWALENIFLILKAKKKSFQVPSRAKFSGEYNPRKKVKVKTKKIQISTTSSFLSPRPPTRQGIENITH